MLYAGGHINPAVTLAFAITKKISLLRAALYITAQVGGAILGSFIVSVVSAAMLQSFFCVRGDDA